VNDAPGGAGTSCAESDKGRDGSLSEFECSFRRRAILRPRTAEFAADSAAIAAAHAEEQLSGQAGGLGFRTSSPE